MAISAITSKKIILFVTLLAAVMIGIASTKTSYSIVIFALVLLVLLLTKRKIFLIAAILMNESFFYFVDPNKSPMLNYVLVISVVAFAVLSFKISKRYFFKNVIFILIIICLFEAVNSYIISGQSISLGIQTARGLYLYLIYFYIMDNFKTAKDIEFMERFIIISGFIVTLIFLLQSILFNRMVFLNVTFSEARFGSVRFFTGFTYVIFAFFITFNRIFTKKKGKFVILSISAFEFAAIIWVSQTRNFILGIMVALAWTLVTQKRFSKLGVIFISAILIFILVNSSQLPVLKLLGSTYNDLRSSSGTLGVRMTEIQFYLQQIYRHPILGLGFYSAHFPQSSYITGLVYNFYLSDVGIIGFVFQMGVIGLLWLIYFYGKIISLIIKVRKRDKNHSQFFGSFFVYCIATIFSTFYFGIANSVIYIVIMISLLEIRYKLLYEENAADISQYQQ